VVPGQITALQARRILAEVDYLVEIWWCLAYQRIPGNEKADEWGQTCGGRTVRAGIKWLTDNRPRRMPPVCLPVQQDLGEEVKNLVYLCPTQYNVKSCQWWKPRRYILVGVNTGTSIRGVYIPHSGSN